MQESMNFKFTVTEICYTRCRLLIASIRYWLSDFTNWFLEIVQRLQRQGR